MEKIKTKEEFFDWVQRLDDQELAEQKKHFEGRDVPSHFTQSWHHGYPFGNTITYCKIKDNIFAKYDLNAEEVDVTEFEDLDVDFSFISKNEYNISQWFNNINNKCMDNKSSELVKQVQTGKITKNIQKNLFTEYQTKLLNSNIIWCSTPTEVGDILKARHSFTNEEYDLTDLTKFNILEADED